jgi:CheY-like chemotaxis protein
MDELQKYTVNIIKEKSIFVKNDSTICILTPKKNFDILKVDEMDEIMNKEILNKNYQISSFSLSIKPKKEGSLLIAIIDDVKLVRENTINLLNQTLISLGIIDYQIIEGSDGIDLINMVRNDKEGMIKCIFIDENMGYLNGSEAVKITRRLEENKKILKYHIVSITAFDDDQTKKNILNSGINSILSKPVSKTSLINELKKISFYV